MADDTHETIEVCDRPNLHPGTSEPDTHDRANLVDGARGDGRTAFRPEAAAPSRHLNTFVASRKAVMQNSNMHLCKALRHHSFTAQAAFASISGLGIDNGDQFPIAVSAADLGAPTDPTDITAQA
uniref:hypothetical protein n=1 Tax=Bradyrhizobium sp. (strain ORS 278) TaxID=114615 RepID=UPI00068113F5|nr:hypothetical protein [Bradyrhizobium sp. ORS 278]